MIRISKPPSEVIAAIKNHVPDEDQELYFVAIRNRYGEKSYGYLDSNDRPQGVWLEVYPNKSWLLCNFIHGKRQGNYLKYYANNSIREIGEAGPNGRVIAKATFFEGGGDAMSERYDGHDLVFLITYYESDGLEMYYDASRSECIMFVSEDGLRVDIGPFFVGDGNGDVIRQGRWMIYKLASAEAWSVEFQNDKAVGDWEARQIDLYAPADYVFETPDLAPMEVFDRYITNRSAPAGG